MTDSEKEGGDFWPDKRVDAVATLVVFCALVLMAIHFISQGG